MNGGIIKSIGDTLSWGFTEYRELIFGICFGLACAWIYHRFIGMRIIINSYKQTIRSKNETILAYKQLLNERLEKIKVEKESEGMWKKLKKFFNKATLS